MRRIRVFLADEEPIVVLGFKSLLHQAPDIEIVGEVTSVAEVADRVTTARPDLLVLGVRPGLEQIQEIRACRSTWPHLRVLVRVPESGRDLRGAVLLGAEGYVPRSCEIADLLSAVRAVGTGKAYLHPGLSKLLLEDARRRVEPAAAAAALSPQEWRVLEWIAHGKTSREIGVILKLSHRTVDAHRASVMKKLGLHTIASLTEFFLRGNNASRSDVIEP